MRREFECSASPTALAHRHDEGVCIVWMPRILARVKRPGPSRRSHHPPTVHFYAGHLRRSAGWRYGLEKSGPHVEAAVGQEQQATANF